ncbi:MAG: hypothetical protein JXB48_06085 [Candidatus Latescibacteria bacterium]|nr:hypothetical protein [Candidatus Latescibacterota bacterium]
MDTSQSHHPESTQYNKSFNEKFDDLIERIIRKNVFGYLYMVSLLVFILLCGYVLLFSGSLFIEAIVKGWWKPDATEFDSNSFFYGYLFGFPSLCGVIGGLIVLSTNVIKMFRFKVLFFVPSVVWSTLLVLDILRRPMEDWYHWFYLIPAMLLCVFVLFCVVKKVHLPYLSN